MKGGSNGDDLTKNLKEAFRPTVWMIAVVSSLSLPLLV